MRRLVVPALLLAACAAPPGAGVDGAGGPATPRPAPIASVKVSAADLSGSWVFGDRGEPGPGPVATCSPAQLFALGQEGERLEGTVTSCVGICSQLERFAGKNRAGEVELAGTYKGNLSASEVEVRYQLRFDPQTQHLRGTRDGRPFWAAPWVDPGPGVCGVRPSTSPVPTR